MVENNAEAESKIDLGPGSSYSIFTSMEDLLEKLKLLEYDRYFLKLSNAYKPLSRTYFAQKINTGEQFFLFTNLAAWLIHKVGNVRFLPPEEHDDPNAIISSILNELRKLDININFSPNKLKVGYGEHCIFVLDNLADAALKEAQFEWKIPIYPKLNNDLIEAESLALETDKNYEAEAEEEEMNEDIDDDDDEEEDENDFLDLEGLKRMSSKKSEANLEEKSVLYSKIDANEWKMEVERATPSLKVVVRQDGKDWRNRFEQMTSYKKNVDQIFKVLQPQLERMISEIEKNMEKIDFHEQYLNTELESMLSQYRTAKDHLAEMREKYKEASGGSTERSKQLSNVTEELEQTKQELEEKSLSLTDGAPLVKVKQALSRLQQETLAIDVQIGVIEQMMLQAQLRDTNNLQADLRAEFVAY